LLEEINLIDGAYARTFNEVFDPETGLAVITKMFNEWQQPIYSHTYMAHDYYEGMNGAYKNYRATIKANINGTGLISSLTYGVEVAEVLFAGDEVLLSPAVGISKLYYVEEQNGVLYLRDGVNNAIVSGENSVTLTVMRSGHRNQQATQCGTLVTLGSYNTNVMDILLDAVLISIQNNNNDENPNNNTNGNFTIPCIENPGTWALSNSELVVNLCGDQLSIQLPLGISPTNSQIVDLVYSNGQIELEVVSCSGHGPLRYLDCIPIPLINGVFTGSGTTYLYSHVYLDVEFTSANFTCLYDCIQVLQASSTTFRDKWNYN
jgi:hypothetical protein